MTRKDLYYLLCLVFLGLAAILPGIDGTALLAQGDEYMHIATVRESLDAESYFLPVLNGGTNYHKPPLLFWFGMISEAIFGRSLWADRMPAVFLGILSVLLVYGTLRTLRTPRYTSFLVAAGYLFSLAVIKFGRLLMMEQALVASMLAVAFFFVRYLRYQSMWNIFFAGFISAWAYLYKGPLFQVYSGLLLTVWAVCLLWRFDLQPFRWRGRSAFWKVFKVFFVFHISLIVPVLWIATVFYASSSGALLMKYFFQFENVGKFLETNQPEMRILGGWLIYTLPWTILFGAMCFAAFRTKIRTPARLAGWVLLWAAILFTLLHLLPNRKDGYYILPAWPLALIGLVQLVNFRTEFIRRFGVANVVAGIVVSVLLLIAGSILRAELWFYLWIVPTVMIPIVLLYFWKSWPDHLRYAGLLVSGILVICSFQFAVMPLVDRPDAPKQMRHKFANKLCIISNETWDGFVYKNLLPGYDIRHVIPESPEGCGDGERGIIVYRLANYDPPAGYEQTMAWPVWKEGMETAEILEGLKNPDQLQMDIVYYSPIQSTEGRP